LEELFQGIGPSQSATESVALVEENKQLKAENLALKEEMAKDNARHQ